MFVHACCMLQCCHRGPFSGLGYATHRPSAVRWGAIMRCVHGVPQGEASLGNGYDSVRRRRTPLLVLRSLTVRRSAVQTSMLLAVNGRSQKQRNDHIEIHEVEDSCLYISDLPRARPRLSSLAMHAMLPVSQCSRTSRRRQGYALPRGWRTPSLDSESPTIHTLHRSHHRRRQPQVDGEGKVTQLQKRIRQAARLEAALATSQVSHGQHRLTQVRRPKRCAVGCVTLPCRPSHCGVPLFIYSASYLWFSTQPCSVPADPLYGAYGE